MNFTADKQALLAALTTAGKATGKNVLPILEYSLFNINNDILEITGANMEVFLTQKIEIKGSTFSKKIAVPSAGILTLVKSLPEVPINFLVEEFDLPAGGKGYNLNITAGKGKYTLPAENGDDFPEFKQHIGEDVLTLKSDDLLKGIYKTLFACPSDDMGNPNIAGVCIIIENDKLIFVATNSGVLSAFKLEATLGINKTFMLSARALSMLQGMSFDEEVELSVGKNGVRLQVNEDTAFMARLVEAKFPDYKSVIPKDNNMVLTADKTELMTALRRIVNFANSLTHTVKFSITSAGVVISAEDDVKGKANEEIAGDYNSEPLEIGFNANFLIECLKRLDSDNVMMNFKASDRPMIMNDAGNSDDDVFMLCMPMYLTK